MREFFAVLSVLIIILSIFPYAKDIIKGRAVPARSTRIMFLSLLIIAIIQQKNLGSGLAIWLTFGEIIGSISIFLLTFKYGRGGFSKIDKICYLLLLADLTVWYFTKNNLTGLGLTILADMIAVWPTAHKTWLDPKSETVLWWSAGVIAPIFALLAEKDHSFRIVLFPMYLIVANLAIVLLIVIPRKCLKVVE